eukprot:540566-Prorocentrum_minimum.AAC.1
MWCCICCICCICRWRCRDAAIALGAIHLRPPSCPSTSGAAEGVLLPPPLAPSAPALSPPAPSARISGPEAQLSGPAGAGAAPAPD